MVRTYEAINTSLPDSKREEIEAAAPENSGPLKPLAEEKLLTETNERLLAQMDRLKTVITIFEERLARKKLTFLKKKGKEQSRLAKSLLH